VRRQRGSKEGLARLKELCPDAGWHFDMHSEDAVDEAAELPQDRIHAIAVRLIEKAEREGWTLDRDTGLRRERTE
jgi:hypothetical protein